MLNVANLSKPSDKQESQTISSLYNLLLNNDFIRWNGTEIKIRPPQGLTTINKINFRSFTGDLLPYTSLDLPDLNITLKIFVSDNFDSSMYSIILDGCDNTEGIEPYHEVKNEQKTSDTTKNIITSFNKAWTYDSSADSQIEYNINELVNYLNEVLLSWFGHIAEQYKFGYYNDNQWHDYDIEGTLFEDVNGQLITHDESGNKYYYIDENNDLKYKNISFNLNYSPFDGMCCSDNGLIYAHAGGNQWNSYNFYSLITNTASFSNVFEQHYPNTNLFNNQQYPVAFSSTFGIMAPYINTGSISNRKFTLIRAVDNKVFTKTFDTSLLSSEYSNFVICGINEISTESIVVYTLGLLNNYSSTALDLIPFNIYVDNDNNTLTINVQTDNIINNIITIDDYKKQNMYELNEGITYTKMVEATYNGNDKYLCFDGKVIIKIDGNEPDRGIVYLHTYKVNQNGESFYLTQAGETEYGNYGDVPMFKRSEISIFLNQNIDYAYRLRHYPGMDYDIYIDNSYPILSVKSLTNSEQQYSYYQNGKFTNYKYSKYFDKFECYYANNGIQQYPINSIDNHISYNDVLFEYKNGTISFPSIVWNDNSFITFVPIITTSPKYFNICYDIPQTTTLSDYSITQNDVTAEFHGLNRHVYSTLETLLLLKYEYNDLMLRVNNFPNTDNFVFSINETCCVDFKKMNCNSNNQELNVNLCDSSGNAIDYDTIKKLYGKVILAIDWEQT